MLTSNEDILRELRFQNWYQGQAKLKGLNPNPDHPSHKYDFRGLFNAMQDSPELQMDVNTSPHGFFPSQFKQEDNPTEIVAGTNTQTGEFVGGVGPGMPSNLGQPNMGSIRDFEHFRSFNNAPATQGRLGPVANFLDDMLHNLKSGMDYRQMSSREGLQQNMWDNKQNRMPMVMPDEAEPFRPHYNQNEISDAMNRAYKNKWLSAI